MITPHCIQLCLSLLHLSYSVADSHSGLSDLAFNFICCGFWWLLACLLQPLPSESTRCFCWCSCSVLSSGILCVGAMLCCCSWRWREAERIIPDDRGIKCVAVRWRPELMLSCLFWFSTSSEAVPSKLRMGAHSTQSVVPFIKGWGCHTSLGPVSSLNQGFMLYSSSSAFFRLSGLELSHHKNWQNFCSSVLYNVTYLNHLLEVSKVYVFK